MPNNDLSRINNLLKEVASNAELADKVFARLAQTIAATGKNVNVAGIQSRIETTGRVPERMRLTGGQRLSRNVSGLVSALEEFLFPAEFEREYRRLVDQAVSKVKTRMSTASKGFAGRANFDIETEQALAGISARATGYVNKTTRNVTGGPVRPVGIGRQEFDAETDRLLNEAAQRAESLVSGKDFEATYNQIKNDIVNNLRSTKKFIDLQDQLNKEIARKAEEATAAAAKLNRKPVAINTTIGGRPLTAIPMSDIAKNIPPEEYRSEMKQNLRANLGFIGDDTQFQTVWKSIEKAETSLAKFGRTVTNVTTSSQLMSNNLVRINATVTDNQGATRSLIFSMDEYGNVLDVATEKEKRFQEALAQRQKKIDALKPPAITDVEKAIGAGRTQSAFDYAKKFGVTPDDLKRMQVDARSNVATLSFQKMLSGGVPYKLDVTVDQYGKAMARANTRLMNFTDSVVRNTQELFKWSIGVGIIYGSYQKLEQLIEVAIENQTKLADVAVTLGSAQRDLNSIFDDAAEVAAATNESINAVLETYTMAYRAVGSITDPMQRTTAANKLLTDATVLNKLSNLDAAQSIDVLSGSLRQSEKFLMQNASAADQAAGVFSKGSTLLDKWVRVTRIANVDLGTLSTAFSVTAESALNAGMNVEELNAVIASLSEKIGGLGGEETGNAVRAIIGGVYQEQATAQLAQFGIAVQDTNGKMRNFLDISKDINEMWRAGIIDDTQLNKIAYTLGGGVRRGQQYVAFLTDLKRIQEIQTAQTNSEGEAQAALGIKMETVSSAITKLGNSFQGLAQTLGTSGGILDSVTGMVNATSKLVDLMNLLSKVLGRLVVPASILALLKLYIAATGGTAGHGAAKFDDLNKRFAQSIGSWITNLIQNDPGRLGTFGGGPKTLQGRLDLASMGGFTAGAYAPTMAQKIGTGVSSKIGTYGLGFALASMPAISRLSEGKVDKAAYDLAGAAIGTGIGGALGGPMGAMVGGQLGAFIAEKFVSETMDYEGEFANFFSNIFKGTTTEKGLDKTAQQKATDEVLGMLTPIDAAVAQWVANASIGVSNFFGKTNMNPITREQAVLWQLQSQKDQTQYQRALGIIQNATRTEPKILEEEQTTFYQRRNDIEAQNRDYLKGLVTSYRQDILTKEINKEITAKEYRAGMQTSLGLPSSLSQIYAALDVSGQIKGTDEAKKKFKEFADLIVNASEEDVVEVTKLVGEIQDLSKVMDELKTANKGVTTDFRGEAIDADDAATRLSASGEQLVIMLDALKASADKVSFDKLKSIQLIDIFEGKGFDKTAEQQIVAKAKELQMKEMQAQLGAGVFADEAQMRQFVEAAEPILFYLGQEMGYMLEKGIVDSKFLQQAIEELGLPQMGDLGYSFMDATTAQLMQATGPMYDQLRNSIIAAGGKSEETAQLVIPSDDPTNPLLMTKDWAIVQHLLQEILKVNEKQLDGMYNLPTGASFYVPFQAWKMDTETRQASAQEGGEIDTAAFNNSTGTLYDASGNLIIASSTLEQAAAAFMKQLQAGTITIEDIPPEIIDYWKQKGTTIPYQDRLGKPIENIDTFGLKPRYPTYGELPTAMVDQYGRPLVGPGSVNPERKQTYFPGKAEDDLISSLPQQAPISFAENIMQGVKDFLGGILGGLGLGEIPNGENIQPVLPNATTTQVPQISTSLAINLQTQTQLLVDGRILAEIVKPYLYEDMVAFQDSAGSSSAGTLG